MTVKKRGRGRPKLSDKEKLNRKIAREEVKRNKPIIKQKKSESIQHTTARNITKLLVTPSGKCPFLLVNTDKDSVKNWVDQMIANKFNDSMHTVQSMKYWVRDFYDIHSKEYKEVTSNIDEISSELGVFDFRNYKKDSLKSATGDTDDDLLGFIDNRLE